MKNPKKLSRNERKVLEEHGFDSRFYLMVKKTAESYTVYNTETKQTHEIER